MFSRYGYIAIIIISVLRSNCVFLDFLRIRWCSFVRIGLQQEFTDYHGFDVIVIEIRVSRNFIIYLPAIRRGNNKKIAICQRNTQKWWHDKQNTANNGDECPLTIVHLFIFMLYVRTRVTIE